MKNKKINYFDALMALIVLCLLFLGVYAFINKSKKPAGRLTILKVAVNFPEQADMIYAEASKLQNVYLDSVNTPIKTLKVEKIQDPTTGKTTALNIYLEGLGEITANRYVFDGVRVLIGQKAEIHGNYFAPGAVSEIKYAN